MDSNVEHDIIKRGFKFIKIGIVLLIIVFVTFFIITFMMYGSPSTPIANTTIAYSRPATPAETLYEVASLICAVAGLISIIFGAFLVATGYIKKIIKAI
jgi:hypothetical protein